MEQLDHRQLLAVTLSGNVTNDFTAATPAVYLTDPNNQVPLIPPVLQQPGNVLVNVSGFQVNNIAVNYDQATDTLSVGFLQPPSGLPNDPYPVIAGDADDNGLDPNNQFNLNPQIPDNSTTAPGVPLAPGQANFVDSPGISGEEHFFAVLDLSGGTNTATQSIFAGIPQQVATPGYTTGRYVVAPAVFGSGLSIDSVNPQPGAELTANEGNVYLGTNDPRHGAFEFQITHFAQLYQQITGHALTNTSVISFGASAGSGSDGGISEEVFHFQPLAIGGATTVPPVVPPPPPPIEIFQPTILINPHENRHINTAHYDNIRVTILSSSSFDATQINPLTVTLDGAPPVSWFPKMALHDGIVSETFVFKGTDVNLPGGFTEATISGATNSGQTFTSSELVFNRNDSYYNAAQIANRDQRLGRLGIPVAQESGTATAAVASATATPAAATPAALTAPVPLDSTVGSTTTVKLTPRQQYAANAAARKAALYSTAAATSFTGSSLTSITPTTAPTQSAALDAHDLALQSLASGSASAV